MRFLYVPGLGLDTGARAVSSAQQGRQYQTRNIQITKIPTVICLRKEYFRVLWVISIPGE